MQPFLETANQIAWEIKTGKYPDTLPSIANLAEQFQICPSTVKRILFLLRDWDLVTGEHGRCVRVNPKAVGNVYFHKNVVILAELSTIATPFYTKTLEQLTQSLNALNICVHVFISENQVKECAFNPDCAVVINNHSRVIEESLLEKFPKCSVVRLSFPSDKYPYVMSDGKKAGYEAMRHLVEDCGYTQIGILTTQLMYTRNSFKLRYDGALDYVRKHKHVKLTMKEIPELELCSQTSFNLMEQLLKENPNINAIFATCDMLALGVYSYSAKHQLTIPDDIAVIGFDNENFGLTLSPQLTTMSENEQSTSQHLYKVICDLLMDRKTQSEYLTDPLLIIRESTKVKNK